MFTLFSFDNWMCNLSKNTQNRFSVNIFTGSKLSVIMLMVLFMLWTDGRCGIITSNTVMDFEPSEMEAGKY
jgi:hypothetical protein